MANITINELLPSGSELFLDSETFLSELVDEEANLTYGGKQLIRPSLPICLPRPKPCLHRPLPFIPCLPIPRR